MAAGGLILRDERVIGGRHDNNLDHCDSTNCVVIPQKILDHLGLKQGQALQVVVYDDRIVLVPDKTLREARGMFKGLDLSFEREKVDREFS